MNNEIRGKIVCKKPRDGMRGLEFCQREKAKARRRITKTRTGREDQGDLSRVDVAKYEEQLKGEQ